MDKMNTLDQLIGKRRTYEDLSRFVGEKVTGAPNYSFLLGAGCSVSSGIRTASQLVKTWRREVFGRLCLSGDYTDEQIIDYLSKNQAGWYNAAREYSSLFEKIYDLPRQRRMFVEKEVSGKEPNLGYAYLTKLVDKGFLNTIFTTNFDDLINEAFFRFSQTRPMVCAHDSSISSITITSKRPKIIKLHGDYLFDDIKSTVRETESLEENIRKKMIEFGRDFGLVVIGYNGGDRSVMEVLQYLLRGDEYFKNGIYWCLRKGDEPSDELIKLLWRDRVYYVEVDGFDETMASLHNDMVGDSLPIDTSLFTDKPRRIISQFCENTFLKNSPSEIIRRDLAKLEIQEGREHLLSAMREAGRNRNERDDHLNDRELVKIIEIKQSIAAEDFPAAREKISLAFSIECSPKMKQQLFELKVKVEDLDENLSAALAACDDLIKNDPNDINGYLRKSYLLHDSVDKLKALDEAIAIDYEISEIYSRRLEIYADMYQKGHGADHGLLDKIDESLDLSLRYNPSSDNDSWDTIINFYEDSDFSRSYFIEKCDQLINRCGQVGRGSFSYLNLNVLRYSKFDEDRTSQEATKLLSEISRVRSIKPKELQPYYQWMELDALSGLKKKDKLSQRLSELGSNPEYSTKRGYLKRMADYSYATDGDIKRVVEYMEMAIQDKQYSSDIIKLAHYLNLIDDYDKISDVVKRYSRYLTSSEKVAINVCAAETKGDFERALGYIRSKYARVEPSRSDMVAEVHCLMCLNRYTDAKILAKKYLDGLSWNKVYGGELIVNFELAKKREGERVDKGRLGELAEIATAKSVKLCCYYLMDNEAKAKSYMEECFKDSKGDKFLFKKWAIFKDAAGAVFLERFI